MAVSDNKSTFFKGKRIKRVILMIIAGVLVNVIGSGIMLYLDIPLYMDSIGTIFTSICVGMLPGITVGLITNLIKGIMDPASFYYSAINVLIAVVSCYYGRKFKMKRALKIILGALVLAFIGGGLGSVLTWFLYGFASEGVSTDFARYIYDNLGWGRFSSQLVADYYLDVIDKIISLIIVELAVFGIPDDILEKIRFDGWQQKPLDKDTKKASKSISIRGVSLRTKLLLVIVAGMVLVAGTATTISYMIYRDSLIENCKTSGDGIANLVSHVVDGNRIDDYLLNGEEAEEYIETKNILENIKNSANDIEYLYVYKIMEDGCHVVFDIDTSGLKGEEVGSVIPFDKSFAPYIPDLLIGREIEPIITDDTYGWLLTVYKPILDSNGVCTAYAATDVSMNRIAGDGYAFFAKLLALFTGFFVLIAAVGVWFVQYNILHPVNAIALAASGFTRDTEEGRHKGAKHIHEIDIRTGDEIENLYDSFVEMTDETIKYEDDLDKQATTIKKLQDGLIFILADVVESRDKCTGQHIKKTALYAGIILDQMKKDGVYSDIINDKYIEDVVNSAPLHDVGKINVPDAILNKPGKLTDEEYEIMKTHTVVGREILSKAIAMVPGSDFLHEARRLASYHHERWDGKGYPTGLAGEDIPLSARVMAVADVFDALVSKRSYKEGFGVEKAINIIIDGKGKQFDPVIVDEFIKAEVKVREVAERAELP
ncbi:MAG: HD domain-containing protein [Lachnospiraceae bacterium]|nr:HD domain-containing protein [Lachnospiraceae bacterium]